MQAEMVNAAIGARLAQIRKARGLRQKQAADFLQISNRVLSYYEKGKRTLPYAILIKMAELYGVAYETVLNLPRPLPARLRENMLQNRDTLPWRIAGMLTEYRETGRFYLFYLEKDRACWVRHDPASPGTVLLSALRPGEPEPPSRRFSAEEFAGLRLEQIAAILRQL